MFYLLNKDKLKKAKKALKEIKRLKELWTKEIKNAIEDRKNLPKKHYHSGTQRIEYAKKKLTIYEKKEKEFSKVIKARGFVIEGVRQ